MTQFVTEAEFQAAVIDLARLCGWKIVHFHDSRRQVGQQLIGDANAKGWPDLVLARGGALLFRELKSSKGKVTDDQVAWIQVLEGTGADACVWRPEDWDEIEHTLKYLSSN